MEINKKKIGIMTWYNSNNFGSVLQAYALFQKIDSLGYSPYLINYVPRYNRFRDEEYKIKGIINKSIKSIKGLMSIKSTERTELCDEFVNKKMRQTPRYTSEVELRTLNSGFAAFVCGSDQIWAPTCFDEKFFLSFVEDEKKIFTYAPSFGLNEIKDIRIKEKIGNLIQRFENLSVRETQGKNLIYENWKIKAQVVVDPTLLYTGKEWDRLLGINEKENTDKEGYILCYFLGDYTKYKKYINRIKRVLDKPLKIIPTFKAQKKMKDKVQYEVGPEQFVRLIRNASFVCTDSFHGMAFSINYNIPFVVFERFNTNDFMNQNSRIYSLLDIIGMEDRVCKNNKIINSDICVCDFKEANKILEGERERSICYLEKELYRSTLLGEDISIKKEFKITDYCCGCGCCIDVCKLDAIRIKRDEKGFLKYIIDNKKCVECQLCKKVCPFNEISAPEIRKTEKLYAVKSLDKEVLKKSSSGGMANEIAKYMIQKNYSICGCYYNENKNSAEHILVDPNNADEIYKLQGSKYIQSEFLNGIRLWRTSYKKDTKVIFFGTPCQIAGIDKLLKRNNIRENYVLVDLICHGVPTQFLWTKYLQEVSVNKKISKNPKVIFRDKTYGWSNMVIKVYDEYRIYRKSQYKDRFYSFFRLGQCYMESCYECPYREKSAADIRLGDYWGERFVKDSEGVSMVVPLTEKGMNIVNTLFEEKKVSIKDYPIEEYWSVQYPSNQLKPIYYDELIREVSDPEYSLKYLQHKYCKYLERRELMGRLVKIYHRISGPWSGR